MEVPDILAALAEPNRRRIVELLDVAPRSVGEVADALALRQPQATKHLQALERAGLVTVHPLGRRRIYALRREPLRGLRSWLERFDGDHPSEDVLVRYEQAVAAEQRRPDAGAPRALVFARDLPGTPAAAWRAWTTAAAVRRWWAPSHFTVADCEVDARPGGALRLVLQEGDGARHVAEGRFGELDRPRRLRFDLAPLDAAGAPLFSATHDVRLTRRRGGTHLTLRIDVAGAGPQAAPAVAGLQPGWEMLLDNLVALLATPRRTAS